jgi:thioredoxin domain-containing protein 5
MQNRLTIAEVDCDAHKALCTAEGISGFPMLWYYNNGVKTEYTGGRKIDALKAFTDKAAQP